MNIVKFDPTFPAKEFRGFFDNFFNRNIADVFGSDFTYNTPSINVIETESAYKVEVAASGLEKEDFEVSVDSGNLSIAAKKEKSDEVKDGKYTRREFNYTSFSRSFALPETVKADDIAAAYANGVLTLTLPKKDVMKVEAARVIDVK
ncbi:MAG: Hsp20/alpha crystallin family protein [Saprospiraceae bacterium]|nr:Hsp20/alpha crystallin family protein [Saprospiraceae bacterium]